MRAQTIIVLLVGLLCAVAPVACQGEDEEDQSRGGLPLNRFQEEADQREAEEAAKVGAPKVEKGVVPDVIGQQLAVAEKAVESAGYELAEVEGGGAYHVITDDLFVCEQDPKGGTDSSPDTQVQLTAERSCE
jgi:hypothetical protein